MTNYEYEERDRNYKNGRNQINVVWGTEPILHSTRDSKLVDFNEVIITDHRGFLFDIDFHKYFHL